MEQKTPKLNTSAPLDIDLEQRLEKKMIDVKSLSQRLKSQIRKGTKKT